MDNRSELSTAVVYECSVAPHRIHSSALALALYFHLCEHANKHKDNPFDTLRPRRMSAEQWGLRLWGGEHSKASYSRNLGDIISNRKCSFAYMEGKAFRHGDIVCSKLPDSWHPIHPVLLGRCPG